MTACGTTWWRLAIHAAAILAMAAAVAAPSPARAAGFRYTYDAAGELTQVVHPDGTVLQYVYDADGNILQIKRSTLAAVAILDFNPKAGGAGDKVTFTGAGFGTGMDAVSFNGAIVQAASADGITLVATVPANATTGLVTITAPAGVGTFR